MGNRILILFLLALFAIVLLFANIRVWTTKPAPLPAPARQADTQPGAAAGQFSRKSPEPASAYESLASADLFTAGRKEIIKETPPAEETAAAQAEPEATEVRIAGEAVVLHGIISCDNVLRALVSNPAHKDGEKENIVVKAGDKIANLTVGAIEPNRLVLLDGNRKYTVPLHDAAKQKNAGAAARKETRPAAAATKPAAATRPTVVSAAPEPAQPPPRVEKKANVGAGGDGGQKTEDEYITVKTPFGMMKKKK